MVLGQNVPFEIAFFGDKEFIIFYGTDLPITQ